jgi:hypothetical protein
MAGLIAGSPSHRVDRHVSAGDEIRVRRLGKNFRFE